MGDTTTGHGSSLWIWFSLTRVHIPQYIPNVRICTLCTHDRYDPRRMRYDSHADASVTAPSRDARVPTTTMRARPTSSDEAFAAARVAYTRARDPALAIELFDDGLRLLDEEARKRSPSRARDDATTTRRRAEALANQARCFLTLENAREACARAERAIACDETYAKAHARRAEALRRRREYARARLSLETCRTLLTREGGDESTAMVGEVDAMVREMDAEEARGVQAARTGMQMKMGATPPRAAPAFVDAEGPTGTGTEARGRRVSFDPRLDVDVDVDDDDDDDGDGDGARERSRRAGTWKRPMLMELGVEAAARAILARDDARARREDAVESFQHKRCKMCGNVCHAKLTTCTSCCLPLVSPESYEAASVPRVGDAATDARDADDADAEDDEEARFGEDAIASSTRAEDDDGDASERSGPWWARHFTREALETPTLAAGVDPALRWSFAALDVAPGASEMDVRKAYRRAVVRAHPDAGGSMKELRAIQRAYDAISLDFWRRDEGAARLRQRVDASGAFVDGDDDEEIFVALSVYRNREGEHTLKRLFERARDPSRVFVGVTWQYKSKTPPPDALGARIDRLHFQVNVLTEEITKQAEKITDAEEQDRYLKKMRRWQLKELRTEDEEEKRCHSKNALDARFRDNVRETRVSWDDSEGPSYARHLAMRKWGGERYVLHVDAMTVVDEGWDETLVSQLKSLGETSSVLTASPLGYELEKEVIRDADTLEKKYERKKYGTVKDALAPVRATGAVDASRAPAMTCAKTFGNSLLCHMYARRLVEVPNAPTPTLFANVDFTFADARALVRDAPPDAHAPFLYLGEDLSLTARLWTNGWDLYVPSRVPLVRCYVDRPREMWMEDRRSGAALYGGSNLTVGSVVECEEREFLNLISRRRVLQLVGAPDENSETSREEPIVFTETYGAGNARSVESFIERVGVDFRAKTIAPRAKEGGTHALDFSNSPGSLPTNWRDGSLYSIGCGPSELASWY